MGKGNKKKIMIKIFLKRVFNDFFLFLYKTSMKIIHFFKDIFSVLFPKYCMGCSQVIYHSSGFLCVDCSGTLYETNFWYSAENELIKSFSDKLKLTCGASLFFFRKGGVPQKLIHLLKYKNQEEIGQWLGKWLGKRLSQSADFKHINIVIPVPIHSKKLKIRKYNQVALFGKEIAQSLNALYVDDVLIKTENTSAQALKNKAQRLEGKSSFAVQNLHKIEGKNILIVDDVITTGTTILQCANELLKAKGVSVGVASIAYVSLKK